METTDVEMMDVETGDGGSASASSSGRAAAELVGMAPKPTSIRLALWRGLRRRCPHCGRAPLFDGWFRLRRSCDVCGLRYEPRRGDTWALWLIGDRIFIAVLLLVVVLGFRSSSAARALGLLLAFAVPLVVTIPHRFGVCLAVDYLVRARWGPPGDVPSPE